MNKMNQMNKIKMLIIAMVLLGLPMGCASVSKEALDEAAKPVSKEFLLGPEDVLEVTVWRNQDLSRTVVVRPDGKISLPLIGDVQVVSDQNSKNARQEILPGVRIYRRCCLRPRRVRRLCRWRGESG